MKKLPQILISLGILFIIASIVLLVWIFLPVVAVELNYNLHRPGQNISEIKPVDKNFAIVIPKIGANARIIPNVDPYNPMAYQFALTRGVAMALGTAASPTEIGNMFLFSHSSVNLLEATRYNSIFYLLSKLQRGDKVYIFYKNLKYEYVISNTKLVNAKDISYLTTRSNQRTLTLMTCWPPGTSVMRLLVFASISK